MNQSTFLNRDEKDHPLRVHKIMTQQHQPTIPVDAPNQQRRGARWRSILRPVVLIAAVWFSTACVPAVEFYVAANGQDTNAGTRSKPFATLERARDSIRNLKATDGLTGPVTVHVRGGTYALPRTLELGADDSGTEAAPIVYRAYADEKVTLLGGRPITNFMPHAGQILKADLRSQGWEGRRFRVVVWDGKRQELARYPNRNPDDLNGGDWAYVDGKRFGMYEDSPDEGGYLAQNQHLDFWQRNLPRLTRTLKVRPTDIHSWKRVDQGEVSIFPRFNWEHSVLEIESLDSTNGILNLKPGGFYEIRPGDRYFLRNLLEEVDAPGEWYLDNRTWTLYFWPPTPIGSKPVYAATLQSILALKQCAHVTFRGFTLENCDETAVKLEDCTHCVIAANTIRNAGDYNGNGVTVQGGRENAVVGNDIYNVGCHGIELSGGDPVSLVAGGHLVDNNHIHHVGWVGRRGTGMIFRGSGHRASHNLIHDTPQAGITLWGNKHLIEFNHIHHTCLEGEDTGAISGGAIEWVDWLGVVIRNNYIHDTIGFGYDAQAGQWRSPYFTHAVYPDWAASGVQITSNILVRAGVGLIYMHGGRDNVVENNVLVGGPQSQVDYIGWTTATGFWSTKVKEWTEIYEKARRSAAWRSVPAFKDPRQVPLPNGQVAYGSVLRRNIFYYQGSDAELLRFNNVPLDRNESDFNLVFHFGKPLRTGQTVLKSEHGPNLLTNPGLEDGLLNEFPSGWGGPLAKDDPTRVRVVDDHAHEGKRALSVEPAPFRPEDKVPKNIYLTLGSVPFQPGKTYRLSAWLKAARSETPVELNVFSWKKDTHSWDRNTTLLLTPEWRQHELLFRLPQQGEAGYHSTMDTLNWRLTFPSGTGQFWVDDVSLREAQLSDEWEGWQARGMDRHSVVADPLFVDPTRDDYRLKPESPAFKLGFKPIPIEQIGPYADKLRASWPIVETTGNRESARPLRPVKN